MQKVSPCYSPPQVFEVQPKGCLLMAPIPRLECTGFLSPGVCGGLAVNPGPRNESGSQLGLGKEGVCGKCLPGRSRCNGGRGGPGGRRLKRNLRRSGQTAELRGVSYKRWGRCLEAIERQGRCLHLAWGLE